MTSQLPCFGCLFLSCKQQKNTENRAAVTSLRSFLFRDDFSGQIGLWSQQNVLAIEPKTVYGSVTQLAPHFIFMQLHHWLSTWYVRCPQSRLEIDWYWWELPLGDRVIANDAALYIHWSNSPPTIRFSATKKCCNFLSRVFLAQKKRA